MLILFLLLIVSLIPVVLIYFYLKNLHREDEHYRKTCRKLLGSGLLCSLGVAALAAILNIAWALTGIGKIHPLINAFFHDFILAAFVEEFVKYKAANRQIQKQRETISKMDTMAFTGIVAIGFDIIESFVYTFYTTPAQIIVRGLSVPHVAYGFIMGWFIHKSISTGNRSYIIPAFGIPFLLHGCYDFFLSEEIDAVNEYLAVISMILVIVDIVIVIKMLLWFRKEKKKLPVLPDEPIEV